MPETFHFRGCNPNWLRGRACSKRWDCRYCRMVWPCVVVIEVISSYSSPIIFNWGTTMGFNGHSKGRICRADSGEPIPKGCPSPSCPLSEVSDSLSSLHKVTLSRYHHNQHFLGLLTRAHPLLPQKHYSGYVWRLQWPLSGSMASWDLQGMKLYYGSMNL